MSLCRQECSVVFASLASDQVCPFSVFHLLLPIFFGSGGFGSVFTGLIGGVLLLGPLLLGLGVTVQACVSSFGCSSGQPQPYSPFWALSSQLQQQMPLNRSLLHQNHFHKVEHFAIVTTLQ